MPSKAEQVAARVTALLTASLAPAPVFRDREDAFTREESPAVVVELLDESSEPFGGGQVMLGGVDKDTLSMVITTVVRGASWQSVADAVRVQTHAALATDATLRAMVQGLRRDRCEWRAASSDQPFGTVAQVYQFKYLTRTAALDATAH